MKKISISMIILIAYIFVLNASSADSTSLEMKIAFLDKTPYQCSWLPWKDTHFRIRVSICSHGDSTLAIPMFTPCYDCNPKIFLEDIISGKEPKRTHELDVLIVLKDILFYDLETNECFIDTIDFAKFIEWDLTGCSTYQVWLEYEGYPDYQFEDTSRNTPIWKGKIISDTLLFRFD